METPDLLAGEPADEHEQLCRVGPWGGTLAAYAFRMWAEQLPRWLFVSEGSRVL